MVVEVDPPTSRATTMTSLVVEPVGAVMVLFVRVADVSVEVDRGVIATGVG
jgi:hypothetical protein